MPITYTSRKSFTYTLCRGTTKTGKPRFYFSREPKDEPVEQIPAGYTISESVNGIVSLSKERPSQLRPEEVEAVNAVLARHPLKRKYRVGLKPNRIDIYELVGLDSQDISAMLKRDGLLGVYTPEHLRHAIDDYARFTANDLTRRQPVQVRSRGEEPRSDQLIDPVSLFIDRAFVKLSRLLGPTIAQIFDQVAIECSFSNRHRQPPDVRSDLSKLYQRRLMV